MKKILLSIMVICLAGIQSLGQCCPYVDPIEILPTSPLDTDSIYVVTTVTTPNAGMYLGYDIIDQGSSIRIEACYYSGMATVLQTYTDTINLGVLAGGNYTIEFVAYQTNDNTQCVPADSNEVSASVAVTGTLSFGYQWQDSFVIYPNPVQNGIVYVITEGNPETSFQIINTLGELVLQGITGKDGEIAVNGLTGVFYLSLMHEAGVMTQQILISE